MRGPGNRSGQEEQERVLLDCNAKRSKDWIHHDGCRNIGCELCQHNGGSRDNYHENKEGKGPSFFKLGRQVQGQTLFDEYIVLYHAKRFIPDRDMPAAIPIPPANSTIAPQLILEKSDLSMRKFVSFSEPEVVSNTVDWNHVFNLACLG